MLMLQEVFKPKQLFRGGPESAMLKGLTAEDVLKYEQEELGNKDVVPEPGIDLTKIKSENLAWLTETEDQAREYGEASKSDLKDYRVIARDSEGGVLVEKLKSSTEEPTSKGMAKAEMARMKHAENKGLNLRKRSGVGPKVQILKFPNHSVWFGKSVAFRAFQWYIYFRTNSIGSDCFI